MTDGAIARVGWLRRLPAHIAVMLGLSTAAYAVSLAAVATDQSQAEAATAAARAPAVDAIDSIIRGNDALNSALGRADGQLSSVAADYSAAGDRLTALEAALAGFAATAADIDGVSRALPASVPLPAIPKTTRSSTVTTHATTGASCGC